MNIRDLFSRKPAPMQGCEIEYYVDKWRYLSEDVRLSIITGLNLPADLKNTGFSFLPTEKQHAVANAMDSLSDSTASEALDYERFLPVGEAFVDFLRSGEKSRIFLDEMYKVMQKYHMPLFSFVNPLKTYLQEELGSEYDSSMIDQFFALANSYFSDSQPTQNSISSLLRQAIPDAVSLTHSSSDEDQIEAYASLLGYLQPLYYPMFKDDLDDLVHDFWEWMNNPTPYEENVKDLKNVPSGVKVWAIRWLQNLNKSKHHDTTLSARFREELNRASGHINLGDYLDEAYNRIFTFSDKELVSFIRKFKELMKTEKGVDYALSPNQIDMFRPLFEKAQFLLQEGRTPDCKAFVYSQYQPLKDTEEDVQLTEPLVDLLSTLFFEVEGSALSEPISDSSDHFQKEIDSLVLELESGDYRDSLITVGNILDEVGYYLHKLRQK